MKMSDVTHSDYPCLAYLPQFWYRGSLWMMSVLKLCPDGSLKWYDRYIEKDDADNGIFLDVYDDYPAAVSQAEKLNSELTLDYDNWVLDPTQRNSLRLKAEKALTSRSRLLNEENLMLEAAIRKHSDTPRPDIDDLILPKGMEQWRSYLHSILCETPYIHIAYMPHDNVALIYCGGTDWSRYRHGSSMAKICYREPIARGFGLSSSNHWGETKAKIREILLPRANQLLELAGVKRMLAEAEANGQRVLIIDGFVFWKEDDNSLKWTIKEADYKGIEKEGNTIWLEGNIVSKNHGRIVVLPYVKENGEHVQGHTKNAPRDGKAKPRHPTEYLSLPFKVLKGDLMRGLFGELHYD